MIVSPDSFDSDSDFLVYENHSQKVYQLQTDVEEANRKVLELQYSLQDIHAKLDETYALRIREYECARKAIEEASAIVKESALIHVENTKKIEKLSSEVQELKVKLSLLESKRNRANESEKKGSEAPESSENNQQKVQGIVSIQKLRDADVDKRPQSFNVKQQEYEDWLIRCITQNLGFSKGRPVAACVIYKCLMQWQSFEKEITGIFVRIIQTIDRAIKTCDNNNNVLAYWLSNASTLLVLLQHSFEQVEAAYHASRFKQQLTAYVEKIYVMIRDNLKKEIFPLAIWYIQPQLGISRDENLLMRTAASHWKGISNKFDSYLNMLKSNNVPPFLVRKIFAQIYSTINAKLFNSVLLRRGCCTFRNGRYLNMGLSELEHWCYQATEKYAGSALDELKHIRQANRFLVTQEKPTKTLDEIRNDLCPVLNLRQLYRISTTYWDNQYGTQPPSEEVISKMRVLMSDISNNAMGNSLILGDDSSIPFSADDLSKSMDQIDIEDVEPPSLICINSGFSFLLPRAES